MEIGQYWRIVRRRGELIVVVLALALGSYLLADRDAPQTYAASMRFVVGILPESPPGDAYTYDRYYTWLTAEYLVDDLSEVVKSRAFADAVSAQTDALIAPGAIQGMTSAGKLHRILTVSVAGADASQVEQVANGIVSVLGTSGHTFFAQLDTESARVTLIDPPQVALVAQSLRDRLDLPFRLALGVILGLVLAFCVDYVQDAVHDRSDVSDLGIRLLATIPRSRPTWLTRRQP